VIDGPEFVTVAEVAKRLRVSKMTVYRWVRSGDLESVRVGSLIRIYKRSFDQLLGQS
jgi:excisionase family DNA binding protein